MGGAMPANVELWDCAGSSNYEKGWSAFKKDAIGVIYVFDPDNKSQVAEMDKWAQSFRNSMQLQNSQALTLGLYRRTAGNSQGPPRCLDDIPYYDVSLENVSTIHLAFDKLFGVLYQMSSESGQRSFGY